MYLCMYVMLLLLDVLHHVVHLDILQSSPNSQVIQYQTPLMLDFVGHGSIIVRTSDPP